MQQFEPQYIEALKRILSEGNEVKDRTGTGSIQVFNVNFEYDVSSESLPEDEFFMPALRSRKVFPKSAFTELVWYLLERTDVKYLNDRGVHIWDGNSSREFLDSRGLEWIKEGNIGKAYGYQFRNSNGVDQLLQLMISLSLHDIYPDRRMMIDLWNTKDLPEMALPPCVYNYNFMVDGGKLHMKMTQRSADMILGVPANAMIGTDFLVLMARWVGLRPGKIAHSITNAHIYNNLIDAAHHTINEYEKNWSDSTVSPRFKLKLNREQQSVVDLNKKLPDAKLMLEDYVNPLEYNDSIEVIEYDHGPALPKSIS